MIAAYRLSGLVQLLHKLSIRGVQGSEKLLRVIKVSRPMLSDEIFLLDLEADTIAEPGNRSLPDQHDQTQYAILDPLHRRAADRLQHSLLTHRRSDYLNSYLPCQRRIPSRCSSGPWHEGEYS